MPTYHYKCKSCRYEFEELQKMSDPPLVVCPECQKHTLIRIIGGGAGLMFKGSGFYITDYKGKKSSGSSASKTEAKKEQKTAETKSAENKKE